MRPDAVGIDIGGTYVRAALVSAAGLIAERAILPTPVDRPVDDLCGVVRELLSRLDPVSRRLPVGLVLPGVWDRATGIMSRANNLRHLEGLEVRAFTSRALGRRADVVDSDVVAAGWAQWFVSSPRPARYLYLSIGTGVGGAVIADGSVVRDAEGGTWRFGAIVVDDSPAAPAGRTGVPGSLEAVVSAEDGFPRAVIQALAIGLVRLVAAHTGVEVLALGGGRIDRRPDAVDLVRQEYECLSSVRGRPIVRIEQASLASDDAGVIGAALLALQSRL